jgi:hypothetical protein
MIATLIVLGSIAFGAAFVLIWFVRPDVRAWIESPKHTFQANVRRYDRAVGSAGRQ